MSTGDSSPADPLVGKLLRGRFLPRGVVDRTADVVCYAGVDQKTERPVRIQRPVTLKLAPAQLERVKACGPDLVRLAAVPGVVPAVEGGIESGIPFLVLPSLPGGTLADRLRHGRPAGQGAVSARAVRSWLDAAAATLDAVHALGTSHGRLCPDAIVVGGADGAASIDGLPVSLMLRLIGLKPRAPADGDPLAAYRAPELASVPQPTPHADQYSLAAIVAEALGRRLKAVDKALSPQPERRFPSCSAFAAAVRAELDSIPAAAASAPAADAPLELAEPDAAAGVAGDGRRSSASPQGFELELEEIESESQLRGRRRTSTFDEQEDLADITFTKPGQTLLAPKSTYDKLADLGGVRSSWRRMTSDFKSLTRRSQAIARAVIGVVAVCAAFWLLRAAWRVADSLVRSGREMAGGVVEKLQPALDKLPIDVGSIQESGQQFVDQMRRLWEEHVDDDDETQGNVAVAVATDGDAWPARPQDGLAAADLREPADLVSELIGHKGAFTAEGLGVFHVDDPRNPDQPQWIGGFGLLRKPGLSPRPLLHGTLVHHAEDGAAFVGRYARNDIQDFWCMQGPADARVVMHASMGKANNNPVPDGAAFVLDPADAACLALVFTKGELVGGQWCGKKQADGKTEYEPPTNIVSPDRLAAEDDRAPRYITALEAAIAELLKVQREAVQELQKFVRAKKLK